MKLIYLVTLLLLNVADSVAAADGVGTASIVSPVPPGVAPVVPQQSGGFGQSGPNLVYAANNAYAPNDGSFALPTMAPFPTSVVDVALVYSGPNRLIARQPAVIKPSRSLGSQLSGISIKALVRNGSVPSTGDSALSSVFVYLSRNPLPGLLDGDIDLAPKMFWSLETVYVGEFSLQGKKKGDTITLSFDSLAVNFDNEPAICGPALLVFRFDPLGTSSLYEAANHTVALNVTVDCTGIEARKKQFVEIIPDFQAGGHRAALLIYKGGKLKKSLVYLGYPRDDWADLMSVADITQIAYVARMRLLTGRERQKSRSTDSCLFEQHGMSLQDSKSLSTLADVLDLFYNKATGNTGIKRRKRQSEQGGQAGNMMSPQGTVPSSLDPNLLSELGKIASNFQSWNFSGTNNDWQGQMLNSSSQPSVPSELRTVIRFLRLVADSDARLNEAIFQQLDSETLKQFSRVAKSISKISKNAKVFAKLTNGESAVCPGRWAPKLAAFLTGTYQLMTSMRFPVKNVAPSEAGGTGDGAVGRTLCWVYKNVLPVQNDLLILNDGIYQWHQLLGIDALRQMTIDWQLQVASSSFNLSWTEKNGNMNNFPQGTGATSDSFMPNFAGPQLSAGNFNLPTMNTNFQVRKRRQFMPPKNAMSPPSFSVGSSSLNAGISVETPQVSLSFDGQAPPSMPMAANAGSFPSFSSAFGNSGPNVVMSFPGFLSAKTEVTSNKKITTASPVTSTDSCYVDFETLESSTFPFLIVWLVRKGKIFQGVRSPLSNDGGQMNWRSVASLDCSEFCDASADDWDVSLDVVGYFDDMVDDDESDDMNAPLVTNDQGTALFPSSNSATSVLLDVSGTSSKRGKGNTQKPIKSTTPKTPPTQMHGSNQMPSLSIDDVYNFDIFGDDYRSKGWMYNNWQGNQGQNGAFAGGSSQQSPFGSNADVTYSYQAFYKNNYYYQTPDIFFSNGGSQYQQGPTTQRPIQKSIPSRKRPTMQQQFYNTYSGSMTASGSGSAYPSASYGWGMQSQFPSSNSYYGNNNNFAYTNNNYFGSFQQTTRQPTWNTGGQYSGSFSNGNLMNFGNQAGSWSNGNSYRQGWNAAPQGQWSSSGAMAGSGNGQFGGSVMNNNNVNFGSSQSGYWNSPGPNWNIGMQGGPGGLWTAPASMNGYPNGQTTAANPRAWSQGQTGTGTGGSWNVNVNPNVVMGQVGSSTNGGSWYAQGSNSGLQGQLPSLGWTAGSGSGSGSSGQFGGSSDNNNTNNMNTGTNQPGSWLDWNLLSSNRTIVTSRPPTGSQGPNGGSFNFSMYQTWYSNGSIGQSGGASSIGNSNVNIGGGQGNSWLNWNISTSNRTMVTQQSPLNPSTPNRAMVTPQAPRDLSTSSRATVTPQRPAGTQGLTGGFYSLIMNQTWPSNGNEFNQGSNSGTQGQWPPSGWTAGSGSGSSMQFGGSSNSNNNLNIGGSQGGSWLNSNGVSSNGNNMNVGNNQRGSWLNNGMQGGAGGQLNTSGFLSAGQTASWFSQNANNWVSGKASTPSHQMNARTSQSTQQMIFSTRNSGQPFTKDNMGSTRPGFSPSFGITISSVGTTPRIRDNSASSMKVEITPTPNNKNGASSAKTDSIRATAATPTPTANRSPAATAENSRNNPSVTTPSQPATRSKDGNSREQDSAKTKQQSSTKVRVTPTPSSNNIASSAKTEGIKSSAAAATPTLTTKTPVATSSRSSSTRLETSTPKANSGSPAFITKSATVGKDGNSRERTVAKTGQPPSTKVGVTPTSSSNNFASSAKTEGIKSSSIKSSAAPSTPTPTTKTIAGTTSRPSSTKIETASKANSGTPAAAMKTTTVAKDGNSKEHGSSKTSTVKANSPNLGNSVNVDSQSYNALKGSTIAPVTTTTTKSTAATTPTKAVTTPKLSSGTSAITVKAATAGKDGNSNSPNLGNSVNVDSQSYNALKNSTATQATTAKTTTTVKSNRNSENSRTRS